MRRLIAVLMIVIMCVGLAACSNRSDGHVSDDKDQWWREDYPRGVGKSPRAFLHGTAGECRAQKLEIKRGINP